jgi:transcriptional regulator with GAF, ATPase, and Fis domain
VNKERHTRLRSLAHNINRQRKVQARKIDILCNDMVQAHRGLLESLTSISFTSSIHESLIACRDADDVLKAISGIFCKRFGECGIAMLLTDGSGVTTHNAEAPVTLSSEASELPSFFTAENVRSICSGNHVCLLPELLELPVQMPPKLTKELSAAAIPLSFGHHGLGVLLLFASQQKPISEKLIRAATITAPAIAKALAASRQTVSHS